MKLLPHASLAETGARAMRHTKPAAVVKSEGHLIFRVENGRLEDCGLYETRAAAEERMAAMGLSASWKIAAIKIYSRE
jgi:hypothetical protein